MTEQKDWETQRCNGYLDEIGRILEIDEYKTFVHGNTDRGQQLLLQLREQVRVGFPVCRQLAAEEAAAKAAATAATAATAEMADEEAAAKAVNDCEFEFVNFIQFLSQRASEANPDPFTGIDNMDMLLALFKRYVEWKRLRSVAEELASEISRRIHDFPREERPFVDILSELIDRQWEQIYARGYHENQLNIEELIQLNNALAVISQLLRLSPRPAVECLYMLNDRSFREHIYVRNTVLNAMLSDFRRAIRSSSRPDFLRRLSGEEPALEVLDRLFRHLSELNRQGYQLDIVDTRTRVMPPQVAQMWLQEATGECSYTLDDLQSLPAEQKIVLTCGHVFKKGCGVEEWLKAHGKCPTCAIAASINPAHDGDTRRPKQIPRGPVGRALIAKEKPGKSVSDYVVTSCGHVIDKKEMERRRRNNITTCPVCGAECTYTEVHDGGSRKTIKRNKKNSRRKSKKIIKRNKTIKRR